MPLNSLFSWFIKKRIHQIELFKKYPVEVQTESFQKLVDEAALTRFGLEHNFSNIRTIKDFQHAVPIRTYEDFKPYIDLLREGQQNVLWPSKLKWFAKSSGTTDARSKFIPVTQEALEECHYRRRLHRRFVGHHNPKSSNMGGTATHPVSRYCFDGKLGRKD